MNIRDRKMSPELRQQLANAEAEANKFNKAQGSLTEKAKQVYKANKFNMKEELTLLQNNNIIDKEWKKVMEEEMSKSPEQMEHDALEVAGFSAIAEQMTEQETATKEVSQEPENSIPEMSEDEKLQLVAKELSTRFGDKAPQIDVLKKWKALFCNIFILDLGEKNIYIYRYLNRQEWKQINADANWTKMPTLKKEEYIVGKCLLFPKYSIEEIGRLPGGTFSMLSEQIQLQSMFLPPVQIAEITLKI